MMPGHPGVIPRPAVLSSRRHAPPFRAEHVGSFLRPAWLLEARNQFRRQEIDAAALRAVEDRAITEIVAFQERVGLPSITDGELRRRHFHTDFLLQLDGVDEQGGLPTKFHKATGDVDFAPPVMAITGRVKHAHPIEVANYQHLRSLTTHTPRITIPSPTMLHFRGGREGISREIYPDLSQFFADVVAAYQEEVRQLGEAGLRYLQFDDTNLAYLCDTSQRERARARGEDPDSLPRQYAQLINGALASRPADMVTAIHLCRGNYRSSWAAEGGYEPVAEVLFNELDVDAFFLEYDDARSGDFQPLRHVPKNKTVVLGLVTTKLGQLESKDDIKRRIDEAAKYCPLEQLSLSPQCGFASTEQGNDVSVAQQEAKLRLVIEVAREVWGEG
jgi:5-methyltetrahydropteroyltriglutamate--homocysteine methyltransferase